VKFASLKKLRAHRKKRTRAFGKWHIGVGWQPIEEDPGDFHYGSQIHAANQALADISKRVNHFAPIAGGPTDIGFDTFFGTPSNRSRIPVFIRDDRVVGSPVRDKTGLMRDPKMRGIAGVRLCLLMFSMNQRSTNQRNHES
jgi:hypothetical protein